MIRLTDITKSYSVAGEALIVLDRINLHVEKGEFIAIMGPS